MIRIMLADDHEIVRRGLRDLVEVHEGWQVCGEARNGREAVALAADLTPDVAILDLSMPELNGIEATRRIRKESPLTEVLVYTMHGSERHIREVFSAGARGYVLKSDPVRQVEAAVEALVQHRPYFTPEIAQKVLDGYLRGGKDEGAVGDAANAMTSREREILQLLAEGRTNKDIAVALSISVKTVETHRSAIMRKLHVTSLIELTRYAIRNGFLEP
ncbi:MAG TPA: response regulator transcription factor [Thermomicrobiales bacterium]|jgi:DNA-binding NarL/FixJ family response regulator